MLDNGTSLIQKIEQFNRVQWYCLLYLSLSKSQNHVPIHLLTVIVIDFYKIWILIYFSPYFLLLTLLNSSWNFLSCMVSIFNSTKLSLYILINVRPRYLSF